jgi:type I restriction enzyme S subunit
MVREGDVLINSTGVGTLGRVAQVLFVPAGVAVDSHVTIVRPANDIVDADFLGLTLLDRETGLATMGVGSTGQTELGRGTIADIQIVMPPLPCQKQFSDTVGALRRLPISIAMATATLRATHDLLLPRLVSGEIDVTDMNIAVPDAAA